MTAPSGKSVAWTDADVFPYRWGFVVRVLAVMWLVGAIALFVAVVAAPLPQRTGVLLAAAGVLALMFGVVLAAGGSRLPAWTLPASLGVGLVLLPLVIVGAGGGAASVALTLAYVWALLVVLLFLSRAMSVAFLLVMAVGYGVAHVVVDLPVMVPIMLLATAAVTWWVMTALLRAREAIIIDPLTRLPNRRGVELLLEQAISGAEDADQPLSVGVVDIDGFHEVNLRHGRQEGDRLLRQLADGWRGEPTHLQVVGRLAGDRFAVLLPGHGPAKAKAVVERLRATAPEGVSCTAGVATWQQGDSISMLIGRAEAALYEAKRGGRQRTVADKDDPEAVRALSRAIDGNQFIIYYQPKVSLGTGRITGFEALVRWQHPDRGLLPPSEFITLAEDSGLIVRLGEQVLRQACHQARAWADRFPDQRLSVAVNVTGRQLDDPGLLTVVERSLADSGLPADLLTVEVTETTLGEDAAGWLQRLEALRTLGMEIAMDDFGTGYSSLNRLRTLPVGSVKIDRSFVSDLPGNPEAEALIAAMIGVGRGLGRSVVAEGVETVEQLTELTRLGCDEAQGFLFGRPLPPEMITALIHQQHRFSELRLMPDQHGPPPAVQEVVELIGERADLEEVVRPLLDDLVNVSGLESAYLTHVRWDRLEQEIRYAVNTGELEVPEGKVIAWADTVCCRALEQGPTRTDDVPAAFPDSAAGQELGLQSYATAPVVLADGTVFGTLCVASRRPVAISDELATLLRIYSRLIADKLVTQDGAVKTKT